MRTDPTNPRVVGGAFGEHSWLPLPGYVEPAWISVEPIAGGADPAAGRDPTPVGPIDVQVWAPTGIAPIYELPLLLSHDGPEFAAYAGLTHYAGAMVADGTLPPFRLALIRPTSRNLWYAANPQYAEALTQHVLPAVTSQYRSKLPVLMGASLGGAGRPVRRMAPPGHLRRALPAVRLLLHDGDRPAGVRSSSTTPRSPVS